MGKNEVNWDRFFKEHKLLLDNIESRITEPYYPESSEIYKAFKLTPFDKVKVVILGQDPYHGPNQANGLAFSVNRGVKMPPSLKNIFKELRNDLGVTMPAHGDLSKWAKQGVLLLNTCLTVKPGKPNSHNNVGWQEFIIRTIVELSSRNSNIVWVLWGNKAKEFKKFIRNHHFVIESKHPSPFSANKGFFGSKPFSKINSMLTFLNKSEIDWSL